MKGPRLGLGLGGSSTGGFKPTQFSGCALWLRADLGVTIATGASVWADQSGTGDGNKNVLQATGSKQPTVVTWQGQKALSFATASAQYLQGGAWATPLTQTCTVIIIGQCDTGNSGASGILDDRTTIEKFGFYAQPATPTNIVFVQTPISNVQTNIAAATPFCLTATATTSLFTNRINGTTSTTTVASANQLTGTIVGALSGGVDTHQGKIAEIVMFNRLLASAETGALYAYVESRYGIAA